MKQNFSKFSIIKTVMPAALAFATAIAFTACDDSTSAKSSDSGTEITDVEPLDDLSSSSTESEDDSTEVSSSSTGTNSNGEDTKTSSDSKDTSSSSETADKSSDSKETSSSSGEIKESSSSAAPDSTIEKELGVCGTDEKAGTVKLTSENIFYRCESGKWVQVDDQEEVIGDCPENGDTVRTAQNILYRCELRVWTRASDVESNLGYCTLGRQGVALRSSLDERLYLCDALNWRKADELENVIGFCTVGNYMETKTYNKWAYRCENEVWVKADSVTNDLGYCVSPYKEGNTGRTSFDNWLYRCEDETWVKADSVTNDLGYCVSPYYEGDTGRTSFDNWLYRCEDGTWTKADSLSNDLGYCTSKNEGDTARAAVNKVLYGCKSGEWVALNEVEKELGICTGSDKNKIYKVGSYEFYVCFKSEWIKVDKTTYDLQSYGDIGVNKGSARFRRVEDSDSPYGYSYRINDTRDGSYYKFTVIGDQLWMSENLNYADSSKTPVLKGRSWCYDNKAYNCADYGRLYTWAAAIDSTDLENFENIKCGNGRTCTLPAKVSGICPSGFHLPDTTEWNALVDYIAADKGVNTSEAGTYLKSFTGWEAGFAGKDYYNFFAYPAGRRSIDGNFGYIGEDVYYWSVSEYNASSVYGHGLSSSFEYLIKNYASKTNGYYIRCVMD